MLGAESRRLLSTSLALDDVAVTCARSARVSGRPSICGIALGPQSSNGEHACTSCAWPAESQQRRVRVLRPPATLPDMWQQVVSTGAAPGSVMASTHTRCSLPHAVPRSMLSVTPQPRQHFAFSACHQAHPTCTPAGQQRSSGRLTQRTSAKSKVNQDTSVSVGEESGSAHCRCSGVRPSWRAWRSTQSPTSWCMGSCC
jgi:hypothetical protein